MDLKEYFEKLELEDIHGFKHEQTAEDLFLEFKTANFPNGKEFDKKNFCKCLSGFANSSGGIVVWGVSAKEQKEKPDVASELKPIKDLIGFETYLKRNEGNAVVPLVEGVQYKRVFEDDKSGYLVMFIPPSSRAPHMAMFGYNHYYKRSGDSFYQCEHFDIMDMINRKSSPDLVVNLTDVKVQIRTHREEEYIYFEGIISVDNIGQATAKHITLSIDMTKPYQFSWYGLDGNNNRGMNKVPTNGPSHRNLYSSGSEIVLHPGMTHQVDKIVVNERVGDNVDFVFQVLVIHYTIAAEGMKQKSDSIVLVKQNLMDKIKPQ